MDRDSIDRIRSANLPGRAPRIRPARGRPVPRRARRLARDRRRRRARAEAVQARARAGRRADRQDPHRGPRGRRGASRGGRAPRRASSSVDASGDAPSRAARRRRTSTRPRLRAATPTPTRRKTRDGGGRRRRTPSSPRGDAEQRGRADDRQGARAEAKRIVAEASKRKRRHRGVIADLEQRRDAVLGRAASGSRASSPAPRPSIARPASRRPTRPERAERGGCRGRAASRRGARPKADPLKVNTREGEPTSSARSRPRSAGGPERHHQKTAEQGKLPVRERVARLVDPESFAEEALLANWDAGGPRRRRRGHRPGARSAAAGSA